LREPKKFEAIRPHADSDREGSLDVLEVEEGAAVRQARSAVTWDSPEAAALNSSNASPTTEERKTRSLTMRQSDQ
jgi:hypothetical protein